MQTSDPMNTRFAHDSIYTRNATPTNTETLWNTVMVIFEEARCCKNYMRDEGAWCSKVVEPLLTLALGGGFGEPIFQWENMLVYRRSQSKHQALTKLPVKAKPSTHLTYQKPTDSYQSPKRRTLHGSYLATTRKSDHSTRSSASRGKEYY